MLYQVLPAHGPKRSDPRLYRALFQLPRIYLLVQADVHYERDITLQDRKNPSSLIVEATSECPSCSSNGFIQSTILYLSPISKTFALLEKNITENRLSSVEANNKALSNKEGW
jgi:hypothetical protein